MSLEDLFSDIEEIDQKGLDDRERSDVMRVLSCYSTSQAEASDPAKEQIYSLFQDYNNGRFALIADDATCAALLRGLNHDQNQTASSFLNENEAKEDSENISEDVQRNVDLAASEALMNSMQNVDENRQDEEFKSAGVSQVEEEYRAGNEPFIHSQKPDQHRIRELENHLRLVNQELINAWEDADSQELRANNWKQKAQGAQEDLETMKQNLENAGENQKTMQKIAKAKDRIAQQERKIADHEQQIEENSSGMMKSIHRSQIRHNNKVIDQKNRKISKLVQSMQDQNLIYIDENDFEDSEGRGISFFE